MASSRDRREQRLTRANLLILKIASTGRCFFASKEPGSIAASGFLISDAGKVWFIDGYSRKRFAVTASGRWSGFTNGGTMRALVLSLRDYINTGKTGPVLAKLGPWPEWVCGGDLWGYGPEAMEEVRAYARETLEQLAD